MKKIVINFILATIGMLIVIALFIAAMSAMEKQAHAECMQWIEEVDEYAWNDHYYWTPWQVDQCAQVAGYHYTGRVN